MPPPSLSAYAPSQWRCETSAIRGTYCGRPAASRSSPACVGSALPPPPPSRRRHGRRRGPTHPRLPAAGRAGVGRRPLSGVPARAGWEPLRHTDAAGTRDATAGSSVKAATNPQIPLPLAIPGCPRCPPRAGRSATRSSSARRPYRWFCSTESPRAASPACCASAPHARSGAGWRTSSRRAGRAPPSNTASAAPAPSP